VHDGVQPRIPCLDARNRCFQELRGAYLPGPDELRQREAIELLIFGEVAHDHRWCPRRLD